MINSEYEYVSDINQGSADSLALEGHHRKESAQVPHRKFSFNADHVVTLTLSPEHYRLRFSCPLAPPPQIAASQMSKAGL